jgi:hypothetical protein
VKNYLPADAVLCSSATIINNSMPACAGYYAILREENNDANAVGYAWTVQTV